MWIASLCAQITKWCCFLIAKRWLDFNSGAFTSKCEITLFFPKHGEGLQSSGILLLIHIQLYLDSDVQSTTSIGFASILITNLGTEDQITHRRSQSEFKITVSFHLEGLKDDEKTLSGKEKLTGMGRQIWTWMWCQIILWECNYGNFIAWPFILSKFGIKILPIRRTK